MPVNYNDEAGYRRLSVIEGFRMKQELPLFELEGTASLQLLADDMRMDQDYTARPVFTLQQTQLSGAATAEVLARRKEKDAIWQPVTGFFTFYKLNRQKAPVHFKRMGIQELILDNANKNIPSDIGYLAIPDEQMPIYSGFLTGSWNAALFHESVFRLGRWTLTAGLRLDYEGASMDYDCLAQLHYQFVPTMKAAKAFEVPYRGNVTHHYFQVLPKVSALFEATDRLRFFGTVSKGYRAGGFNTQIFSDILQYQTMTALMKDLGVYLDKPMVSVVAGNTEYNPEKAWNFEVGARYGKGNFRADAALYWIEVRDQQLTVFPEGAEAAAWGPRDSFSGNPVTGACRPPTPTATPRWKGRRFFPMCRPTRYLPWPATTFPSGKPSSAPMPPSAEPVPSAGTRKTLSGSPSPCRRTPASACLTPTSNSMCGAGI